MNDLSKTRIIILLTDSSQKVTDTEMQDAYDEFIRQLAVQKITPTSFGC